MNKEEEARKKKERTNRLLGAGGKKRVSTKTPLKAVVEGLARPSCMRCHVVLEKYPVLAVIYRTAQCTWRTKSPTTASVISLHYSKHRPASIMTCFSNEYLLSVFYVVGEVRTSEQ
jgi:hypothetical protein